MFCPNCGAKIEDNDVFCGVCGAKISEFAPTDDVVETVVESESDAVTETAEEPKIDAVTGPVVEPPVEAAENIESVAEPEPTPVPIAMQTGEVAPATAKTSKPIYKRVWIYIVAAVVILAAVVLINFRFFANTARKLFMSDEAYYQYVEGEYAQKMLNLDLTIYDEYFRNAFNVSDRGYEYEISAGCSDEFLDDMAKYVVGDEIELDWLKDIKLTGESGVRDYKNMTNAELTINGEKILSGEFIGDCEEGNLYAACPQLFEDYLGVDISDEIGDMDALKDTYDMIGDIYRSLPDKSKLNKVAGKYIDIAIGGLNDVSIKDYSLKASGVKQNVSKIKVDISEKDAMDVVVAELETFIDDDELRNLLKDSGIFESEILSSRMYNMYGADMPDFDEIYDELIEEAEDVLDEFQDYECDSNEHIDMEVYVDNKGDIVGRKISFEGVTMEYAAPKDGSKLGFVSEVSESYNSRTRSYFKLSGTGENHSGKISGTFGLEVEDEHMCDIVVENFDTDRLWNAEIAGDFTLTNFASEVVDEIPISGAIRKMGLKFETNITPDTFDVNMKLLSKNEEDMNLHIKSTKCKASKISVPSSSKVTFVEDERDIMEILEDLEFDALYDALYDAGIPDDYIDLLEDAIDSELRYATRRATPVYDGDDVVIDYDEY